MAVQENRVTAAEALNRGLALHQSGNLQGAEAIYRRVLSAQPQNADALHLLGVLARQSGRVDEAIELIRRAIAVNPQNPTYHSNLGTAFESAKASEAALAAYGHAIKLKPDFPEAHLKLGALLLKLGKRTEALPHLRRAVELKPNQADWLVTLGDALSGEAKHEEAIQIFRSAIALDPKSADVFNKLGLSLTALGRHDEALAAYQSAVAAKPDHDSALFGITCTLLGRSDYEALIRACKETYARDPGNRRMVSSEIVALTELGRRDEALKLLDFDHLVRPREIAPPEGYADIAAFNAALAHEVTSHPTLVFEKSGHATRFGGHTDNILVDPTPAIGALERRITEAVEDYARNLHCDATHPVVAAKPEKWKLQSWAVVMDTKGHQLPHIHPAAWLSGVYYVQIPVPEKPPVDPHAGWIEFGRPQKNMKTSAEPELRLYQPKEGLMILFPSYLYHMTVPIETKAQRISIAFDVVPHGKAGGKPY